MGNEHGKEGHSDPNGNPSAPPAHNPPAQGEKVKKPGKKPKKDPAAGKDGASSSHAPAPDGKGSILKDIDTSRLKHSVTDPIEDYYTITDKVLGRYVSFEGCRAIGAPASHAFWLSLWALSFRVLSLAWLVLFLALSVLLFRIVLIFCYLLVAKLTSYELPSDGSWAFQE